jgi:hypothetical protein
VLIAAFAVAGLPTMAAVARRVPEFGTLKALGWRSRPIITQIMGASAVIRVIGTVAVYNPTNGWSSVLPGHAPASRVANMNNQWQSSHRFVQWCGHLPV